MKGLRYLRNIYFTCIGIGGILGYINGFENVANHHIGKKYITIGDDKIDKNINILIGFCELNYILLKEVAIGTLFIALFPITFPTLYYRIKENEKSRYIKIEKNIK